MKTPQDQIRDMIPFSMELSYSFTLIIFANLLSWRMQSICSCTSYLSYFIYSGFRCPKEEEEEREGHTKEKTSIRQEIMDKPRKNCCGHELSGILYQYAVPSEEKKVEKALSFCTALQDRSWTNINDFIRHHQRKDDPLDFI